jgi:hypothetical protein
MVLHYMLSEYTATGEGMVVCIYITPLKPLPTDYETLPRFTSPDFSNHIPGKLRSSEKEILTRQFTEKFGGYFVKGLTFKSKEEICDKYGDFLPNHVVDLLNEGITTFTYYSMFEVYVQ